MGEGMGGGESWKSPLTFILSLKGEEVFLLFFNVLEKTLWHDPNDSSC